MSLIQNAKQIAVVAVGIAAASPELSPTAWAGELDAVSFGGTASSSQRIELAQLNSKPADVYVHPRSETNRVAGTNSSSVSSIVPSTVATSTNLAPVYRKETDLSESQLRELQKLQQKVFDARLRVEEATPTTFEAESKVADRKGKTTERFGRTVISVFEGRKGRTIHESKGLAGASGREQAAEGKRNAAEALSASKGRAELAIAVNELMGFVRAQKLDPALYQIPKNPAASPSR